MKYYLCIVCLFLPFQAFFSQLHGSCHVTERTVQRICHYAEIGFIPVFRLQRHLKSLDLDLAVIASKEYSHFN